MHPRHRALLAPLLALGVALVAGCSGSRDLAGPKPQPKVSAPPAPTAITPPDAVRLLQWCWQQRDIGHYRTLFTADFIGPCGDTVGMYYRRVPWTREDELLSAQHLFVDGTPSEPPASSITMTFAGDLVTLADYRPGKTAAVHQYVHAANMTVTILRTDGSAYRVTDSGDFFLTRGDSAQIPQELLDLGVGHDKNRWYIERWDDQSSSPSSSPVKTLPTRQLSLCDVKALYR